MSRIVVVTVAIALCAGMAGCTTARRGEPLAGPLALKKTEEHGREVFAVNCYQCHPGGEGGIGPAINNKPLPDAAVKLQVRKGLGGMPAFPPEEITDAELDDLVAYLTALKHEHR